MSNRMRTKGYQSMTTKIVAMVALFSIIVSLGVMVAFRANESINPSEYLWFQVEAVNTTQDVTGDVYVYNEEGELLEHLLLLNISEWQKSELTYVTRTFVRIYVTFWYLDDKINNVTYLIGRSPIQILSENVYVSIISDWVVPTF